MRTEAAVEITSSYGSAVYALRSDLPGRQVVVARSANPAPVRAWEGITQVAPGEPIGASRFA